MYYTRRNIFLTVIITCANYQTEDELRTDLSSKAGDGEIERGYREVKNLFPPFFFSFDEERMVKASLIVNCVLVQIPGCPESAISVIYRKRRKHLKPVTGYREKCIKF